MVKKNNDDKINQENITFYDQVDGNSRPVEKMKGKKMTGTDPKVSPEFIQDDETPGRFHTKNLFNKAEAQVRENEDASLQDDSYSFDEDNTANEEFHDVDDDSRHDEIDFDNDEDFVQ